MRTDSERGRYCAWVGLSDKPAEELSRRMTTSAETSALEARVGHHYQMDGTYLVGREKLREYARAVQDYHPRTGMSPRRPNWVIRTSSRR